VIAATEPVQRPDGARLLVLREDGSLEHHTRSALASVLRAGDLVIANDAATLPASLRGVHARTGAAIEVRLAARRALDPRDATHYRVVLFGEGDHTTRTEDRPLPPRVAIGDRLVLANGALAATITAMDHPRLVDVRFDGSVSAIWEALARHGRPVQYAHVRAPLRLWDVWTPIAGPPVAVEPPSAGFVLDFRTLAALAARGVEVRFLTHAAGLSSTGDPALDALLPLDEPYEIPAATAVAIRRAKAAGRRVVAIGTTVVRALEASAAAHGAVRAGPGLATIRLGPESALCVVDAILSGTHERGTSHHALLGAFTDPHALARADAALDAHAYRTHEFGDSCLVEVSAARSARARSATSRDPTAIPAA
jgi:S-adenosylmethionine:tRNA ribosyltransferase-isomerase